MVTYIDTYISTRECGHCFFVQVTGKMFPFTRETSDDLDCTGWYDTIRVGSWKTVEIMTSNYQSYYYLFYMLPYNLQFNRVGPIQDF